MQWIVVRSPRLAWVLLAMGLAPACGSQSSSKGETGGVPADALVEQVDMNADGRPDMTRTFLPAAKEGEERRLVRVDVDLNFDGRVDKRSTYNPDTGKLEKVEINYDFDDAFDMLSYYDAEGNLEAQKIDRDFDGKPDVLKRFKKGLLYSRQIDSNGDGGWDLWEYFTKKGEVYRVGKDLDGDGTPEYFEDLKKK